MARSQTPADSWPSLCEEIESCQGCPLHRSRQHVVIHRGSLAPRVLFIGEAPGAKEDETGRPFVGRSGALLDRAIEGLGLRENDIAVINVVKCRPPGNKFLEESARSCRPFLDRQLALLAPELLVPLGAHALRAFVPGVKRVTDATGRPMSMDHRTLFPLLHPAATLRSRAMRARWESDLQALGSYLAPPSGQH